MAANPELLKKPKLAVVEKDNFAYFVGLLCKNYKVFGPVKKGTEHTFQHISHPKELDLDYQSTILPPKKLLHQPFETMFHFTVDGQVKEPESDQTKQIILGVHPCDAHAIALLDKVYMGEYPDPYYKEKRKNTIIVALNCSTVGESCFCSSLGTGPSLESGYDILLTDLGGKYLAEAATQVGADLLNDAMLADAPSGLLTEKKKAISAVERKFKKCLNNNNLPELLQNNFRHPIWDKLAEKCLACGSCTMVCPTCFCYNVVDQVDLNLKDGKRQRGWDSCLLLDFGEVAMGGNFRKDRDARIKQRMYHKLKYMNEQFGMPGCVGCGRCIKACIKKIDITNVVDEVRGESK